MLTGSFLKTVTLRYPNGEKAYQLIEKGKGFDFEYRIKTPDGLSGGFGPVPHNS